MEQIFYISDNIRFAIVYTLIVSKALRGRRVCYFLWSMKKMGGNLFWSRRGRLNFTDPRPDQKKLNFLIQQNIVTIFL